MTDPEPTAHMGAIRKANGRREEPMESATSPEQVPVGALYVGSIQAARWDVVQSRRKCKCPDCSVLPFEERGLEVIVGDGVYSLTLLHPREGSFKTREQLDQEEAVQ